jgi:hypothetical protein
MQISFADVLKAPQKENNNVVHQMPRGKLLGGSSGINYMM